MALNILGISLPDGIAHLVYCPFCVYISEEDSDWTIPGRYAPGAAFILSEQILHLFPSAVTVLCTLDAQQRERMQTLIWLSNEDWNGPEESKDYFLKNDYQNLSEYLESLAHRIENTFEVKNT